MSVSDVLEKYIDASNAKDADRIADLFADECLFMDGAARPLGMPDFKAEGREAIRELYAGIFQSYDVSAKLVKLNPNSMEYDVLLNGMTVPCIGAATCNEDGKITEYMVRAR